MNKEFKYIDLFCGLGAFHYAFNSLQNENIKYDFKIVIYIKIEKKK